MRRLACRVLGLVLLALIGLPVLAGGQRTSQSFAPNTLVHVRPADASSVDAMRGKSQTKAIQDLRPGDEVLAYAEWQDPGQAQSDSGDKLDQRLSYQKVSDMVTSTREQRVVHLTLEDGQTIEATDGHPFKTTDGWRDAVLLKKGGKLLLKGSGEPDADRNSEAKQAVGRSGIQQNAIAVVASHAAPAALSTPHDRSVTIVDVRIEIKTLPVFNIEVANAHTFFAGGEGVLVHNGRAKPPAPGRPTPDNTGGLFVPGPGSGHYKFWPQSKCKGWKDKAGDVWEPQTHGGTHVPHWDRQHPDGTHSPTYPTNPKRRS